MWKMKLKKYHLFVILILVLEMFYQPTETFEKNKVEVTIQTWYINDDIKEHSYTSEQSISEIIKAYQNATLIDQGKGWIILLEKSKDLSPDIKGSGYWGLSNDGVLTIFSGKPTEQKAIQSFYQIQMERLETNKRKQLEAGIPIKSVDDYLEIIRNMKLYE
ncbi:MAG: BofC C-terminal domain-containing protein [Bacilli bacterium]